MATFFLIWLIVSLLFFLIELAGVIFFFFLSFALGALTTAICSLYGLSVISQILVFLGTSVIAFVMMRFIFNPHRYKPNVTNVDILLGKKGVVINDITPGMMGQAKIGGEIWAARSLGTEIIIKGALVEVTKVQGCHLVVKKLEQAEGVQS